jgi:LuxR family transcriptional regulator, maltose regulon positive regulatory protein
MKKSNSFNIAVTRTKIVVPRLRAEIMSRARLLNAFNDLLDYKLMIVAAPAGYGKTSLIIDFAQHTELPVCWYSLDAADQDLVRFLAHFIASIKQKFPTFGRKSLAALNSMSQERFNTDTFLSVIINEIIEKVTEHFVIVLDDYHLVEESRLVNSFVNRFIQEMDENCHFVIASRTLLALEDMSLLVARNQVTGLSYEDLAFDPEEIQKLLLQNYHRNLTLDEARKLADETEGWVTGLVLSTQLVGGDLDTRSRGAKVSGIGLYDYLAQQVLDRQTPPVKEFLMRSSLLEEFDPQLCEEVIGYALQVQADWNGLMQDVFQRNLFVLPVGEEGNWLRYHHLFRDFLQKRLLIERPDEFRAIQKRLTVIYTRRGEWERAYEYVHKFSSRVELVEFVAQASNDLIDHGRLLTLSKWMADLPQELVSANATLISVQGVLASSNGEHSRALELLSEAIEDFEEQKDLRGLLFSYIRRSYAYRLMGNYEATLSDIEQALAIVSQDAAFEVYRPAALIEKGSDLYFLGHLKQAYDVFTEAYKASQESGFGDLQGKILMLLGMVDKSLGRYAKAEEEYQQALAAYQKSGNIAWQTSLLNSLGVLQQLRGEYEAATANLEKAVEYSRSFKSPRLESYSLASLGDVFQDLGATEEAASVYHQARKLAQQSFDRHLLTLLDIGEADLSRSVGDLAKASQLLEQAQEETESSGSKLESALQKMSMAAVLLEKKQYRKAIKILEKVRAYFSEEGQQAEATRALLLLIACQAEIKAPAALDEQIDLLDELLSKKELENLITMSAIQVKKYIAGLAERQPARQPISEVWQKIQVFEHRRIALRQTLRRQVSAVQVGQPKVVIHSLGKMSVKVSNRMLTGRDWRIQTARDLFYYLVSKPAGVRKDVVGETFWPGSSPEELKLKFKNAVYRLRLAVGKDVVLFDNDTYQFNRSLDYEDDAELFIKELAVAERTDEEEPQMVHYKNALKLYKGDYLPELDFDWVYARRESLRQLYVGAILKLSHMNLSRKDFAASLALSQRAIQYDPGLEEAHRLAMRAYAGTGNRTAITRQYMSCRQALLDEFGVEPSEETRKLYEQFSQA